MTSTTSTTVLMTADTVGGVWTYAVELAGGLARHGVRVVLATMGRLPSPRQARAVAALRHVELHASAHALEWMPDAWRDVDAAGAWLLEVARRVRPDVVHVNGYAHAALPWRAPVVVVAHSCVCSWWRAVKGDDAPPSWDEYRRRVAAGLAAASVVVAPTAAILDAVLDAHGVVPAATRVIANGRRIAPAIPGDEPFVLAAGRLWDEAKGLATLAACAARVPWPIRVAGPLDAPGAAAGAPPRGVELLGELPPEALIAWMRRAAIFVLPARYEPFGLVAVEAALAGCALVLGDVPSLREVWGDDAVYVPPGDAGALGAALSALARDPVRRRALATRARGRARALTPARMAAAYAAVYDHVRAARRAAPSLISEHHA